ncbi:B12-binding domain-containing radical SAM protein [Azospirillum sp. B4]|uniref:B12-binding domain-containing radical SAM protein n=1 Tax=Azospirillum sp. B4 TaxID=95605 RepID=UPI0005CA7A3F|nr:B12-binding domain-containing radical SAM protein [Azospirillum sp. B4]
MPRILVGSVYFQHLDPARWAERQPFPPLGTLYAAGTLQAGGHDVHFFDAMIAGAVTDWNARVAAVRPDIAVLYDDNFNYLSKMCLAAMRAAALDMIAAARAAGARVAICSADAADHPDLYLDAGAGAVIVGEGEATLAELAAAWRAGGEDLSAIRGLAWRSAGITVRTPRREVLRDLDALPPPAWELVDMAAYRQIWRRHHGVFALNLVTSRGCPYSCNWCAKPIWGQGYAVRGARAVAEELARLVRLAAPDYIWFMDDIMGLKPRWWRDFAAAVEELGVKVPFKCLSRADLVLRDGAVEDLKRAGCDIVWLGAESGSQAILDAMDKDLTTGEIAEATARLRAAGIRVGHFLQFGYPGEGMGEIAETLALLRATRPDELGISVSYPLPGTVFHDRVQSQLREKRHWDVSSDMAMLYRGPYTTAFYRHLHAYVHRDFRLRRAVAQLRDALMGRGNAGGHLRALAFIAYCGVAIPLSWVRLHLLRLMPHPAVGGTGAS